MGRVRAPGVVVAVAALAGAVLFVSRPDERVELPSHRAAPVPTRTGGGEPTGAGAGGGPQAPDARRGQRLPPDSESKWGTARLSGHVLERTTGRPALGMVVVAAPGWGTGGMNADWDEGRDALVQPDGSWHLDRVPAGQWSLLAFARSGNLHGPPPTAIRKLALRDGDDIEDLDFDATRGGSITLSLVDPDGRPVADVRVLSTCYGHSDFWMSSPQVRHLFDRRSGADGTLALEAIPIGRGCVCEVMPTGLVPVTLPRLVVTEAEPDLERRVVLSRGSAVRGRVVDADGVGVSAEVNVKLMWDADDPVGLPPGDRPLDGSVTPWDTAAADGRFELRGLGAGRYRVDAKDAESVIVEVDGEHDQGDVVLKGVRPEPSRDSVTVLVVTGDGDAVAGAMVIASDAGDLQKLTYGTTDSEGRAHLDTSAWAPGSRVDLTVHARTRGDAEGSATVGPGATVTLVLRGLGSISGRVDGASDAALAGGFAVGRVDRLGVPEWGEGARGGQSTARPDGTFAIPAVRKGTWRVVVKVPGYAPATSAPVEVGPEEEVTGVLVRVEVGAVVSGHVVSASGEAVGDAMVLVTWPSGPEGRRREEATANSEADGAYRVDGLPSGDLVISATAPGHAPARPQQVKAAVGRDARADLRLRPAGRIEGRVLDDGAPQSAVLVTLEGTEDLRVLGAGIQRTIADGRFAFEGVPPGEHLLTWYRRGVGGDETGYQSVVVRAARTSQDDIALGDVLPVSFRVDPPGDPGANVQVLVGDPTVIAAADAEFVDAVERFDAYAWTLDDPPWTRHLSYVTRGGAGAERPTLVRRGTWAARAVWRADAPGQPPKRCASVSVPVVVDRDPVTVAIPRPACAGDGGR